MILASNHRWYHCRLSLWKRLKNYLWRILVVLAAYGRFIVSNLLLVFAPPRLQRPPHHQQPSPTTVIVLKQSLRPVDITALIIRALIDRVYNLAFLARHWLFIQLMIIVIGTSCGWIVWGSVVIRGHGLGIDVGVVDVEVELWGLQEFDFV